MDYCDCSLMEIGEKFKMQLTWTFILRNAYFHFVNNK